MRNTTHKIKAFAKKVAWSGRWRLYTTPDGKPLTPEELAKARTIPSTTPDKKASEMLSLLIGRAVRVHSYTNVITTAGRQKVNEALAGSISAASEAKINYEELGTGTTTPAASDTGLETPDASTRQTISSLGVSGSQLNITSFWSAGSATGTWKEYGCFINGTSTSNSGTLFAHVGIDITVGSSDALTIDGTVTQSI
ncbi:hypothetical protein D6783_03340 [Candidatus Woesearchaeota archaeon]|nr:MAG: hypothetical protein D6783_03340 [Candidatus Woesearchaeota archaeon]